MTISMKITGEKAMMARLKAIAAKTPVTAGAALYQEARNIMTESKADYVPYDEGILLGSGDVEPPKIGPTVSVTLKYGGAASAYALAVHEHPSAHSPPSWSGGVHFKHGGVKYLERPLLAAAPGLAAKLAARLRVVLR